MLNKNISSINI